MLTTGYDYIGGLGVVKDASESILNGEDIK